MNKALKSLGITTLLAFLAIGIWRAEITYRTGWKGLEWVYNYLFSPWVITFLVVLATLTPFYIGKENFNFNQLKKPFITLFAVGIVSYHVAYPQFFALGFGIGAYVLALIAILNGILFYFIMNRNVAKVPIVYGFLVILAVAIPLFQASLFGGSEVDDVKEGFPFFFVVLNLGVLSTFVAYYINRKEANA